MALIGRILIILVAFFAASLAAGIVLVFSIVFPAWGSGRLGFAGGRAVAADTPCLSARIGRAPELLELPELGIVTTRARASPSTMTGNLGARRR